MLEDIAINEAEKRTGTILFNLISQHYIFPVPFSIPYSHSLPFFLFFSTYYGHFHSPFPWLVGWANVPRIGVLLGNEVPCNFTFFDFLLSGGGGGGFLSPSSTTAGIEVLGSKGSKGSSLL